ncbi:hypothetical protein ABC795_01225 [Blastococcus sp. HT6-30]|uniref:hypothetical protein n=1 Tax=Blastococcus sp. HT6-30 TaxID=3144843 RepID=UPI003219AD1B
MTTRIRVIRGLADHPCRLCGEVVPELVESRSVRRLRDRLNVRWDANVRLTEVCRGCGARIRLEETEASLH